MYNNNSSGRDFAAFNMPRARINKSVGGTSDIPESELTNRNTSRRRCNGALTADDAVRGFDNVDRGGTAQQMNGNIAHMDRDEGYACIQGNSCGVDCTDWGLKGHPVAMVYSPCQPWNNIYKTEIALERGTVFKDLDLPFEAPKKRGGLC